MSNVERPVDRINKVLDLLNSPTEVITRITSIPEHKTAVHDRLKIAINCVLEGNLDKQSTLDERSTALNEALSLQDTISARLEVFAHFLTESAFIGKLAKLIGYTTNLTILQMEDLISSVLYEHEMLKVFDVFRAEVATMIIPELDLGAAIAELIAALYAEEAPLAVIEVLTNDALWKDGKSTGVLPETEIIELPALPAGTPATTTPDATTTPETGVISPTPEAAPQQTAEQMRMLDLAKSALKKSATKSQALLKAIIIHGGTAGISMQEAAQILNPQLNPETPADKAELLRISTGFFGKLVTIDRNLQKGDKGLALKFEKPTEDDAEKVRLYRVELTSPPAELVDKPDLADTRVDQADLSLEEKKIS